MPWLRLRVTTPRDGAEAAEDRLRGAGAITVSLLPAAATTVLEPDPGTAPLWDSVHVEALFPVDCDLSPLRGLGAESDFVADQDWSETWRKDHGPLSFGRLLVLPKDDAPPPGDVVTIRLDPGLAFGTGTHPTTAMCLNWLAGAALTDVQVLDVGCGSGILAIAAARLGAAAVVAVDHDAQARQATRENARINGIDLTVLDDLTAVPAEFDVAIANIVSNTLCQMADVLTRLARTVVLSGILPDQVDEVVAAYRGVRFDPPEISAGWAMLVGVRREF
ncbi:MAG: 50S ribosomal protein L11 methyltransferase [Gammaproteobacteria bacterium]|nr:50S ribosomal protein L11 methyltransferase [Gammaproteobacteria bacterium]